MGLGEKRKPESRAAFIIDELTDLVEEAVLRSSTASPNAAASWARWKPATRRGKIQEESMHYETLKHTGELPIVGVNTYRNPNPPSDVLPELRRSTDEEKQGQINRLRDFQGRNADAAPACSKTPQGRRHQRRKRLRRADRRGPGMLTRPNHRRLVRGGRAVSAEYVTSLKDPG